jgi:hypothetical protein
LFYAWKLTVNWTISELTHSDNNNLRRKLMGITCNLPASDLGPCKQRAAAQDPGRDYLPSFEGPVEVCMHACCANFGLYCMQNVGCQIAVRWLCTHSSCVSGPITTRHSHAIVKYKQSSVKRSEIEQSKFSAARSDIGF